MTPRLPLEPPLAVAEMHFKFMLLLLLQHLAKLEQKRQANTDSRAELVQGVAEREIVSLRFLHNGYK